MPVWVGLCRIAPGMKQYGKVYGFTLVKSQLAAGRCEDCSSSRQADGLDPAVVLGHRGGAVLEGQQISSSLDGETDPAQPVAATEDVDEGIRRLVPDSLGRGDQGVVLDRAQAYLGFDGSQVAADMAWPCDAVLVCVPFVLPGVVDDRWVCDGRSPGDLDLNLGRLRHGVVDARVHPTQRDVHIAEVEEVIDLCDWRASELCCRGVGAAGWAVVLVVLTVAAGSEQQTHQEQSHGFHGPELSREEYQCTQKLMRCFAKYAKLLTVRRAIIQ